MNENYVENYVDEKFSVANAITAIFSSALTVVGLVGNSVSLVVILHSIKPFSKSNSNSRSNLSSSSFKSRAPRINCKKYLITFLATNIIFLLAQFYSNTLNRLIYLSGTKINVVHSGTNSSGFVIDEQKNSFLIRLNLVDTSVLVCRLMYIIKNGCRVLSSLSTALFSIERLLAVYKPIKMIDLKYKSKRVFKVLFLLSLILSIIISLTLAKGFDLILVASNSTLPVNQTFVYSRNYIKSPTPTYTGRTCQPASETINKSVVLLFSYSVFMFTMTMCYFIVSISILLIIVKLKRRKKFNKSATRGNSLRVDEQLHELQTLNQSLDARKSACVLKKNASSLSFQLNEPDSIQTTGNSVSNQICHGARPANAKNWHLVIVLSFYLINFPTFVSALVFGIKRHELESIGTMDREQLDSLVMRRSIYIYLTILHVLNHSVTVLLLLVFGKLFRFHFKNLFHRICSYVSFKNQ